jgi:hypothetical protein
MLTSANATARYVSVCLRELKVERPCPPELEEGSHHCIQHTPAYVSIRYAYVSVCCRAPCSPELKEGSERPIRTVDS